MEKGLAEQDKGDWNRGAGGHSAGTGQVDLESMESEQKPEGGQEFT